MTTTITALYDTIRLEEKLLIESAKKNEINLEMVDCKKLSVDLNEKKSFDSPVLQRCVSYYRNIHSTAAIEGQGVRVVNCLNTGIFAGNKLFTHMLLQKSGVPTPNATVAFSKDAISSAKILTKFSKENKNLKILGGIMGKDILDVAGLANVATLPTLDEARAKIVGILRAPGQKIASILLAPASKIAILALEKSKK